MWLITVTLCDQVTAGLAAEIKQSRTMVNLHRTHKVPLAYM